MSCIVTFDLRKEAAAIAAAQSSGSSSNFGGDLGTGASDAAGYGGVW